MQLIILPPFSLWHTFLKERICLGATRGAIFFPLALKAPIMTTVEDIHKYFFHFCSEKRRLDVSSEPTAIRLDVSSESSARQRIHLKHQVYFLQKIEVKN